MNIPEAEWLVILTSVTVIAASPLDSPTRAKNSNKNKISWASTCKSKSAFEKIHRRRRWYYNGIY
jgi:hypothetical protein